MTTETLRRCTKCVMPETWQGIQFDEQGVCSLCREYEKKGKIDWIARQRKLRTIMDTHRSLARAFGNKYDCLVGLSGGKDSVYTLWAAKKVYGMRPLAVTFDHGIPMCADAEYNLQRIPELLDCDHLRFSIGRGLRNSMARHTSQTAGDACYFCHMGVGAFPARISKLFDIPLQIWGEPTGLYQTTGDYHLEDEEEQDREHFEKVFSGGVTPQMALPPGYELRDMLPMTWPTGEFSLRAIYLGNYEPWDQREHVKIITEELDWKHIPTRVSYCDYDKCDCKEGEELRDVQKFYRRRLSRVAFQASKDIRENLMTRDEAIKLVNKYESRIPGLDVDWVLGELGFSSKEELLGMTKSL